MGCNDQPFPFQSVKWLNLKNEHNLLAMPQKTIPTKQLQSYINANKITKKGDGKKTPYVKIPQITKSFHFALERKKMT